MKPSTFEYHAPESLDEALSLLAELGDEAVVLAGGQSLVPMLALRLATPAHVVDVSALDELRRIGSDGATLALGAGVRQQQAIRDPAIGGLCPLLAEALPLIGHRETRSRGTIGGSIAHADPAAEIPTAAVTLGARVVLRSRRGERELPADAFIAGPFMTAREPDELLTEIRLPGFAPRTGWSYRRLARRRHDIALVGVAALVRLDEDDRIAEARLGFAGVGATPLRVPAAEAMLAGRLPEEAVFEAAAAEASAALEPSSDVLASGPYRRHVAGVLARRALGEAAARAREARP